ncbi:hypothetical protein SVIOM342S_00770 [Streptomyces violaceorubidus]
MTPYKSGAVYFAWGVLLAVFSVLVAPRMQRRFGSLKVLGGSLVLLAADVLVLGYGNHTAAIVCTILSGAFIGVNNTVYTELALGVSDAPRPVASAGYNFVRWFAAAAAPYFAPKIEEWTDVHIPFVVAAVTALLGAVEAFGELLCAVEPFVAEGEDPALLTETFWAGLHGLVTLTRSGRLSPGGPRPPARPADRPVRTTDRDRLSRQHNTGRRRAAVGGVPRSAGGWSGHSSLAAAGSAAAARTQPREPRASSQAVVSSGSHRGGDQPALYGVAAEVPQTLPGLVVLHALGDDEQAERVGEVDGAAHDLGVLVVDGQPGHERAVDLQLADGEPAQVDEGGVARSKSSRDILTPCPVSALRVSAARCGSSRGSSAR